MRVVFRLSGDGESQGSREAGSPSGTLSLSTLPGGDYPNALIRYASNQRDGFVFVQGQHCQAKSPTFDACHLKN